MGDYFLAEAHILLKLLYSLFLGGLVGWQRESTGHEAGIRTFAFICLGSCVFGILSELIAHPHGDPGRIAAQVISGIGFIGVGMIIRDGSGVKGLTTAATLWCISAVGLSIAFGYFFMASASTFMIMVFLYLRGTDMWKKLTKKGDSKTVSQEN